MGEAQRRWAGFADEIAERGIVIDDIAPARIAPLITGGELQGVPPSAPEPNPSHASSDVE